MRKGFIWFLLAVFTVACAPAGDPPAVSTPVNPCAVVMTTPLDPAVENIISDAESFVVVGTFTLTYEPVAELLAQAAQRGVNVVVVTSTRLSPDAKALLEHLKTVGVQVYSIGGTAIFHEKVVASEKEALVMSANITERGMTYNYELGVLIRDPEVVDAIYQHLQDVIGGKVVLGKYEKN